MKVYYAHAMCVYQTPREKKDLVLIRRRFKAGRIVNPSRYDDHPEKARDTVGFCLRLIEKCDVVVYTRLLGKVTAGVGKEVNHALKVGITVYELRPEGFIQQEQRVTYLSRFRSVRLYRRWFDVTGGN